MLNKLKKYHRDFEIKDNRIVEDLDISYHQLILTYTHQFFEDSLKAFPELFIQENIIFTMSFMSVGIWYGK